MNSLTVVKTKQDVSNSLTNLFSEYAEKKGRILEISSFVKHKSEVVPYFLSGNKISHTYASSLFDESGAIAALNAEYWSLAMNMTDVLSCMTAKKRNEWNEMIHLMKTPDFEQSSVILTIYDLLQNRSSFLADKVDGIFQKLSRNHITNSPKGFSQRMILDHMITSYGSVNHTTLEYIKDFRSVVAKIMKRDEGRDNLYDHLYSIIKDEEFGQWIGFDGGAFKLRLYKKGTAHLEVDEDMAIELNSILATKYPQAIPSENREKKKASKNKTFSLNMTLLSFEACNVLSDISDSVLKGRGFSLNHRDLSDHALGEINATLDHLGVDRSSHILSFNYDASKALKEISRTGLMPEKKSHQYYPTNEFLARKLIYNLSIDSYDSILEPSAGMGGIASHLPKRQTTCVEISSVHCEALKGMGFKEVICQDFMTYNPGKFFDKIVMNPPFTKNQAKDHLLHAISLLSKEGVLSAILPASYKGKIFAENRDHCYSEVFEGEFEDTKVSVVILTLS